MLVACILPFYLMILLRGSLSAGRPSCPSFWCSRLWSRIKRGRSGTSRARAVPDPWPRRAFRDLRPIMSMHNTLRGSRHRDTHLAASRRWLSVTVGLAVILECAGTEAPHSQAQLRDVATVRTNEVDHRPTLLVVGDSYGVMYPETGCRQNGLELDPRHARTAPDSSAASTTSRPHMCLSLIASWRRGDLSRRLRSDRRRPKRPRQPPERWRRQPTSTSTRSTRSGRAPRSSSSFPTYATPDVAADIPPWQKAFGARQRAWAVMVIDPVAQRWYSEVE